MDTDTPISTRPVVTGVPVDGAPSVWVAEFLDRQETVTHVYGSREAAHTGVICEWDAFYEGDLTQIRDFANVRYMDGPTTFARVTEYQVEG